MVCCSRHQNRTFRYARKFVALDKLFRHVRQCVSPTRIWLDVNTGEMKYPAARESLYPMREQFPTLPLGRYILGRLHR